MACPSSASTWQTTNLRTVRITKDSRRRENTLCINHETKSFFNIILIHYTFITSKIDEDDYMLVHVNKVKTLMNQRAHLEDLVKDEDIIITLVKSLPTS